MIQRYLTLPLTWLMRGLLVALLAVASITVSGCEDQGPMERTGEEIDEAAEEAADEAEEAAEEAEDELDR